MIVKVKLKESYNIEYLNGLISKYSNYKSFYREIKINSLLSKGSLFEIDSISPPIIGTLNPNQKELDVNFFKKSAFSIDSIAVTINSKLEISNIDLKIKILKTSGGKELEDNIDNFEFMPSIITPNGEYGKIFGFYAESIV